MGMTRAYVGERGVPRRVAEVDPRRRRRHAARPLRAALSMTRATSAS